MKKLLALQFIGGKYIKIMEFSVFLVRYFNLNSVIAIRKTLRNDGSVFLTHGKDFPNKTEFHCSVTEQNCDSNGS